MTREETPTVTLDLTAVTHVVAVLERIELGDPSPTQPDSDRPARPKPTATRTEEQDRALPAVVERVRSTAVQGGFRGAVVLASRDHNRISVYSRWTEDTAAAGLTAATVLDDVAAATGTARHLDHRTFDLVWRDGNDELAQVDHGTLVHFGLFTVIDGQADALQTRIEVAAPASLATPGLRTINFHRSQDDLRFVNLGTWSSFERFDALVQQSGFRDRQKYWHGLARFENDYFDVVAVVDWP